MSIYYVDGDFVAADEAVLPVSDLAVLRGYGAFDYLRTYHGEPFRLMRNVQRLRTSSEIIGLEYAYSDDDIYNIVIETLNRNKDQFPSEEYSIRLVMTGGTSPDNITPQQKPRLIVMIASLNPYPAAWYEEGVKVMTVDMMRAFTGAKSTNYIPAILALREVKAQDGVEALYTSPENYVLEGTTSNLFMFKGNTLITPPTDVLPGITRSVILEICEGHYAIEERHITLDELTDADEVFISASNKRVMPVVTVNNDTIGNGHPGELTRHVMELFDAVTFGETVRQ